jgi:hypothetical protein
LLEAEASPSGLAFSFHEAVVLSACELPDGFSFPACSRPSGEGKGSNNDVKRISKQEYMIEFKEQTMTRLVASPARKGNWRRSGKTLRSWA